MPEFLTIKISAELKRTLIRRCKINMIDINNFVVHLIEEALKEDIDKENENDNDLLREICSDIEKDVEGKKIGGVVANDEEDLTDDELNDMWNKTGETGETGGAEETEKTE